MYAILHDFSPITLDNDSSRCVELHGLWGLHVVRLKRVSKMGMSTLDSTCVHFKLRNIMLVATKVHMVLKSYAVLTWMCDTKESTWHVILWKNTKSTLH